MKMCIPIANCALLWIICFWIFSTCNKNLTGVNRKSQTVTYYIAANHTAEVIFTKHIYYKKAYLSQESTTLFINKVRVAQHI